MFALKERGTSIQNEAGAGLTTFMTMAYIIFVNPMILSAMGVPREAAVTGTCLAAAISTLLMGLWSNYPFALASGMGLNAALVIAAGQFGISWQTAMGVIVIEGAIVTLLVFTGFREYVMNAIPSDLKRAIGIGIGLFIAYLGFQHSGMIIANPELTTNPSAAPYTFFGIISNRATLVSVLGVMLVAILVKRKTPGAMLIGIAATTIIAGFFDAFHIGIMPQNGTILSSVQGAVAKPDFATMFQADIMGALANTALYITIFSFMLTDFFDTMGTVVSLGQQGGFLRKDSSLPRLNRVLLIDSLAAVLGGLCGASSVTTYIESAGGIGAGGRTGLSNVFTALLFLLAMFFSPLVAFVPSCATAPVLIIVGFMMMESVKDINFKDPTIGIPAFLTLIIIPLSSSITKGIEVGFISFALLKLFTGKFKDAPIVVYILALIFAIAFGLGV